MRTTGEEVFPANFVGCFINNVSAIKVASMGLRVGLKTIYASRGEVPTAKFYHKTQLKSKCGATYKAKSFCLTFLNCYTVAS